ncbi:Stk1 family PASTA domain-containing Ser/Thr kinase [Brevibacillus dissolubilis]|uniref:Stk1 family PASTA domain-containing Ser/Thr kinase n=1 Tax=Brevibacillus dissolubilis TaxID=1844116 RepID=UPI001115F518|nr:Stk1 family PASTA domain-containing Ser/Thr kinase [Brevibacillus dissolubilis]
MEGQRLGGRYQLEEKIGGGGMAIVYKAKDLVLNRPVAVKLLRPQFGTDDDFVNRFRREAQAVASLSHPNIVSVYDVGQEQDTYYMVMEYIEGSTLKDVINRNGALPVSEAVRIAVQVCDALDHAHQNHIIHRDIKPHNIMIGKNGWVKVTDFGIARAVTSATITHTGSVLGSVHYFSPEQARGGLTGEKSDIYSLGIVLYEMVTGQLPFSGDSPISIALKHLQEPLPEPREINPNIPQSVENVILRALVKDPLLRYESARGMLLDLETCLTPERRNEAKVIFPSDDEEATRVVPAITPDMLEQAGKERATPQRTQNRRDQQEPEEEKPPSAWWKKTLLWLGGIGLFFALVILGFNLAMKIFYVPEINVPLVTGTQQSIAEMKLKDAKLIPVVIEQFADQEKGIVVEQDPAPPMRVKEGASITLYVSKGLQEVSMPNLISLPQQVAEDRLKQDKFEYEIVKQEHEDIPAGNIIDQDPLPNTMVVPTKQKVRLTVSTGKRQVQVPKLEGLRLERAAIELLSAGLAKGEIKEEPALGVEKDTVLRTEPKAGASVEAGSKVTLIVSSGEYPSNAKIGTYPYVAELTEGEEQAEFKILVTDSRGKDQVAAKETITGPKPFDVEVVLMPEDSATIQVFKNGELIQTLNVDYQTFP